MKKESPELSLVRDQSAINSASDKNITIKFGDCTLEQKVQTIGYFRHLPFVRGFEGNIANSFSFNIDDFNKVVLEGCKPQTRKKCVATQTERPLSPSVLGIECLDLYRELGTHEDV